MGDDRIYYTTAELPEWIASEGGQHPGSFPFVRGIHQRMYTERQWRMRQYAGFGTPSDTNRRWKLLLAQGQDGISCAFDLPTQIGLDSDDARAGADAGRLGVAIDSLDDFLELFEGIPLDRTSTTFNINASAVVIYAMLLEAADAQGVEVSSLTGTIANDPLIEFIARGLWRVPPSGALRLMADVFEYSLLATPKFYPINLRGTLVYEAGGSAVQELGYAFACAAEYLSVLQGRGLDMNEVARRFSFLLFADTNVLEEAAKFRAARMVWAHLVKDGFKVDAPQGQTLRFTAAIGNFNLRAQIPELNLVRNSLGALGAALGGCQGMLVAGMDEAFEIPTERAALIGLYTQQVVAYESHITKTVDPLGGSYYIESLTERYREQVTGLIAQIQEAGGATAAIEGGLLQRMIGDSAFEIQMAEESGAKIVVGVNTPGSEPASDPDFELHQHDQNAAEQIQSRLAHRRRTRNQALVWKSLEGLKMALEGDDNVVDFVRAALRAGATIGEVMDRIVARYGEYREPIEV